MFEQTEFTRNCWEYTTIVYMTSSWTEGSFGRIQNQFFRSKENGTISILFTKMVWRKLNTFDLLASDN
ncbi:hypothetical protein V1478_002156 [Vespula squamosa]|uniref:Uncharacterized protein n=1 Tax=Vespula squamosa TaxID=30214 RepID=A0ABD2BWH1_VESSQ